MRCLFVFIAFLVGLCSGSDGAEISKPVDPSAQLNLEDPSLNKEQTAVFDYCFALDTMKAKADDCSKLLTALKVAQEQSADALQQRYKRLHQQFVDIQATHATDRERQWGERWMLGLRILDGTSIVIALAVVFAILRSADRSSLLREPSKVPGGVPGKLSFSRVVGVVGGLGAFAFVGFIANVCLSHLFLTGTMPDQLWPTYAAGVGALFAALLPYAVNKAFC
jgi:hypothetical protein